MSNVNGEWDERLIGYVNKEVLIEDCKNWKEMWTKMKGGKEERQEEERGITISISEIGPILRTSKSMNTSTGGPVINDVVKLALIASVKITTT